MKTKRHGVRFSDEIEDYAEGFEKKTPRPTALQLEKRKERLTAAASHRERKKDTRRKIILGGMLIQVAREGPDMLALLHKMIELMPERERELFKDWTV